MLENEYTFFKKNIRKFMSEHPGEYVVIKENHVLGYFKSEPAAYEDTIKSHEVGTFLIQKIQEEKESVQTFQSRVVFAS